MSAGPVFQVTFDAADPQRLGGFWADVLGYVVQPPPEGFDSWDAFLDSIDWPADERDTLWAIVDPDGVRPRLLFQQVPEGKTAKNRVHLDVNVGAGAAPDERRAVVRAEADRLIGLGAVEEREADENGQHWIVLHDVEGNEFCVQ
ncbi:MAG TPA: VOC family protein [Jatrophihabitantaceae bacterium]